MEYLSYERYSILLTLEHHSVMDIETVKEVGKIAAQNKDPFIIGGYWIAAIVTFFGLFAKPVLKLIRSLNEEKVAQSQDQAEITLYEQLQKQIQDYAADVRNLMNERNQLFDKFTELRIRVAQLETYENTINSMKERLDAKDRIIEQRSAENVGLMREILDLKNRIKDLEVNLDIANKEINILKK